MYEFEQKIGEEHFYSGEKELDIKLIIFGVRVNQI